MKNLSAISQLIPFRRKNYEIRKTISKLNKGILTLMVIDGMNKLFLIFP